jgi:uncharacterized protein (DUF433 family)
MIASLPAADPRVSRGLFTVAEAAALLDVPRSTFAAWVHGYRHEAPDRAPVTGRPIVLSLAGGRGEPVIPFLGLAEGLALGAFRRAGVPLQRIRPALERLDRELGLRHALASELLATDGAELLYDCGACPAPAGGPELVTVRGGQRVFAPLVCDQLRRVRYGRDHWPDRLELPGFSVARVVVDPDLAMGRPVLEPSHVPVAGVVGRWLAGESMAELAGRLGLPGPQVEDVVRAATGRPDIVCRGRRQLGIEPVLV